MQPYDVFTVDHNGVVLRYRVEPGTPELAELIRWVEAHGIDHRRVPAPSQAVIRGDELTLELYGVDERGNHLIDEAGTGAFRTKVTVPLVEGPPPCYVERRGSYV